MVPLVTIRGWSGARISYQTPAFTQMLVERRAETDTIECVTEARGRANMPPGLAGRRIRFVYPPNLLSTNLVSLLATREASTKGAPIDGQHERN
jgi:hypothetical protein